MTQPHTPPYATFRYETCPQCGRYFEVAADGNFVSHRIAFDGQPCSDEAAGDNRDSAAPTIAGRVAAGGALLDEQRPDWYQAINLSTLNIASSCNCVLGQLYGSDVDGAVALGLDWAVTVDCGFDRHCDEPRAVFGELTAEWRRVIEARRAAVA